MYTCVSMYENVYLSAGTWGGQEKVSDPLGQELQGVLSLPNVGAGIGTQILRKSSGLRSVKPSFQSCKLS